MIRQTIEEKDFNGTEIGGGGEHKTHQELLISSLF